MNQYEWYLELEKMTPNQLRKTMLDAYWLTIGKEQKEILEQIRSEVEAIDVTMGMTDYPFIPKAKVLEIIDKYQ